MKIAIFDAIQFKSRKPGVVDGVAKFDAQTLFNPLPARPIFGGNLFRHIVSTFRHIHHQPCHENSETSLLIRMGGHGPDIRGTDPAG
jgi:hypothetical protein